VKREGRVKQGMGWEDGWRCCVRKGLGQWRKTEDTWTGQVTGAHWVWRRSRGGKKWTPDCP
jgi:hypothetical protein